MHIVRFLSFPTFGNPDTFHRRGVTPLCSMSFSSLAQKLAAQKAARLATKEDKPSDTNAKRPRQEEVTSAVPNVSPQPPVGPVASSASPPPPSVNRPIAPVHPKDRFRLLSELEFLQIKVGASREVSRALEELAHSVLVVNSEANVGFSDAVAQTIFDGAVCPLSSLARLSTSTISTLDVSECANSITVVTRACSGDGTDINVSPLMRFSEMKWMKTSSSYSGVNSGFKRCTIINWLWRTLLLWRQSTLRTALFYEVHRGEAYDLSAEEIKVSGYDIAVKREALREYIAAEDATLQLLAALLVDLTTCSVGGKLVAVKREGVVAWEQAEGNEAEQEDSKAPILPTTIMDGLFQVALSVRSRDFLEAKNAHMQAVTGSEKWRIGIFTAGGLHARRNLESSQRDRVTHLINNEKAMASLKTVARMITLCEEKEWAPAPKS